MTTPCIYRGPAAPADTIAKVALTSIEICAGAGGQALGLEQAGFNHAAVLDLDPHACATLRTNRPYWNTLQEDVTEWHATRWRQQVDLFAGGVPCPPFSKAGKQLGADDDRNLFPHAMRLVRECQPKAIMLENVRGLLDPVFDDYRADLDRQLRVERYEPMWRLLYAANYGVSQLRPRTVLVAVRPHIAPFFKWPSPAKQSPPTVGEALRDAMAAAGWELADEWAAGANKIAPTLVGGSHKHGGPDLGPTRARRAWAELGVNGKLVADEPPPPGFVGMPCLTVSMAAAIQGFPADWKIVGRKTHAYRQVGNAFPPPVAKAVGVQIAAAIKAAPADDEKLEAAAA